MRLHIGLYICKQKSAIHIAVSFQLKRLEFGLFRSSFLLLLRAAQLQTDCF